MLMREEKRAFVIVAYESERIALETKLFHELLKQFFDKKIETSIQYEIVMLLAIAPPILVQAFGMRQVVTTKNTTQKNKPLTSITMFLDIWHRRKSPPQISQIQTIQILLFC